MSGYTPWAHGDKYHQGANLAVMPYVWKMAELVARASGYTLANEDNFIYKNPLYKKIFIVNTRTDFQCCKSLPHWTVNEWWEQIEKTFGVILIIDDGLKTMKLMSRGEYYSDLSGQICLDNIVDEFSAEVDSGDIQDISNDSVGFAEDVDAVWLLSEDILNNANIVDSRFADADALLQWGKSQTAEQLALQKDTIWKCGDGRFFIYRNVDTPGFVEAHMCRPRMSRADTDVRRTDVDIELKIVPCRTIEGTFKHLTGFGDGVSEVEYTGEILSAPGPSSVISDGDAQGNPSRLDIEAVIAGEAEVPARDEKSETMYVAIENNGDWAETVVTNYFGNKYPVRLPKPITVEQVSASLSGSVNAKYGKGMSLTLVPIKGLTTLASESLKDSKVTDTSVKHVIKFVSDTIPDPGAIFNIRNRLFVCEKIEANIRPDGLDKLLTGHFYEYDS